MTHNDIACNPVDDEAQTLMFVDLDPNRQIFMQTLHIRSDAIRQDDQAHTLAGIDGSN